MSSSNSLIWHGPIVRDGARRRWVSESETAQGTGRGEVGQREAPGCDRGTVGDSARRRAARGEQRKASGCKRGTAQGAEPRDGQQAVVALCVEHELLRAAVLLVYN
eukprot:961723-Pleurochrysis_carterae.AAC.1